MGISLSTLSPTTIFRYGQIWDLPLTSSTDLLEIVCNEKSSLGYSSLEYVSKSSKAVDSEVVAAYNAFLKLFPEYQLTSVLDDLRESDFSRLDHAGETYVDYMGGSLYPESQVRRHTVFLNNNVLGNTHSVSNR
jgi:hypothetical protein